MDIKAEHLKQELVFTENKGQVCNQYLQPRHDILFYGVSNDIDFYVLEDGISFQTSLFDYRSRNEPNQKASLINYESEIDSFIFYRTDFKWLGINRNYIIQRSKSKGGKENFYLGNDQDGTCSVRSYDTLFFRNIYDGIDLKWYGNHGNLEYDFVVSPGADYTDIKWKMDGGIEKIITIDQDLLVVTPLGSFKINKPDSG